MFLSFISIYFKFGLFLYKNNRFTITWETHMHYSQWNFLSSTLFTKRSCETTEANIQKFEKTNIYKMYNARPVYCQT